MVKKYGFMIAFAIILSLVLYFIQIDQYKQKEKKQWIEQTAEKMSFFRNELETAADSDLVKDDFEISIYVCERLYYAERCFGEATHIYLQGLLKYEDSEFQSTKGYVLLLGQYRRLIQEAILERDWESYQKCYLDLQKISGWLQEHPTDIPYSMQEYIGFAEEMKDQLYFYELLE